MLITTSMLCIMGMDERTRTATLAEKAGLHLPYPQGRQRTSHRPARRAHQPVADARWRKGVGAGPRCEGQERLGVGLMLAYPIALEEDDGAVLVTSPDFPELTAFGDDPDEAVARAGDALEEAIAARIHDRRDIPAPSEGQTFAFLPTLTSVKVILYQGMRDQGVGKAELARRLGWYLPQVDRVLDVQHRSGLDMMDAALGAIGQRLKVTAAPAVETLAAVFGKDMGNPN